MAKYFEVTGNVNQEEAFYALHSNRLKNTFVVINDKPYPGYYQDINERTFEQNTTVFLITKQRTPWASIIRTTEKINNYLEKSLDASFANLSLFNVPHYAIRIKGLKNRDDIETIQKAYQEEGYEFMNAQRFGKEPLTVFFRIKRFFDIKEISEGIYKDKEGMAYIVIDRKIEWKMFREMTKNVKRNISNNNFDVVNAAFYLNHSLVDVIRVFQPGYTIDFINEIKDLYQKEINKYF